jgi:D-psicose/D-tagatose/L-ribulose 3-epimerase
MKFGINTVLWVYPFSSKRLDLLKKVKELGYDTVEIGVTDWSDKNTKAISAALKENDLNCAVCAIPGPDESIISPDKDIQKQGIQFLNGLIDLCTRFNSKILVGPTYSVGKYPELIKPEKRKKAWDSCVKNLKVVGKYAQEKGVKIAIEVLNRYETAFLNMAEDAVNLVKEIDNENIGVQLDIYHMNIEEKNPADAIFKTGKYLYHLHVPEHDRGTPGTGHTDWTGVAKALKKISFKECLVIESCDPKVGSPIAEAGAIWRTYDYGQEELAIRGLKFLKENFI